MSTEKRITLRYNSAGLTEMQQKLVPILLGEGWISEDLKTLNEEEQAEFAKMLGEAIEVVNREHSHLMAMMGHVVRLPAKKLIWENNHLKITQTISLSLAQTGRMPSQAYIAATTGLNRKTVQEHTGEGHDNSVFLEHLRQYSIMAPRVMDTVLHDALYRHDMKAAKLYFDILDKMQGPSAPNLYAGRNNYIYINNYVIRQESLRRLSDEQLMQIVDMVRKKDDDLVEEEIREVGDEGNGEEKQ
jgi:hypothetical protein